MKTVKVCVYASFTTFAFYSFCNREYSGLLYVTMKATRQMWTFPFCLFLRLPLLIQFPLILSWIFSFWTGEYPMPNSLLYTPLIIRHCCPNLGASKLTLTGPIFDPSNLIWTQHMISGWSWDKTGLARVTCLPNLFWAKWYVGIVFAWIIQMTLREDFQYFTYQH